MDLPSTQSIVGKWQPNHDEHELKAFIDRYVSSSLLPVDDSGLRNLVTELQRHTQSASGEKNEKSCCFNYPWPIAPRTVVANAAATEDLVGGGASQMLLLRFWEK